LTLSTKVVETTMKATMKTVRIHSCGGPDVLQFEDVPVPKAGTNEILVCVYAAGVNPVDWKIRQGLLGQGPLPQIMGSDFSGVVEAIGPTVPDFRIGEAVFGVVAEESGSYAEFAVAPESRVASKPAPLDHVRAAALPIASLTAWQALFDTAQLQTGQKVLVHAAAGGVGRIPGSRTMLASSPISPLLTVVRSLMPRETTISPPSA
jgi:NADPH:quinone reductase-like Zn-dependent oxidoreductase